jgi:DNA-binding transcriptional LysR family regulator
MKGTLDSRQLRAFSVLARTGSFTQTARELNLTQSGVSYSLKSLETATGCRLLDKMGKKVIPTQAGEQLLQHATRILQEMSTAQESLNQLGKQGSARLRLGATTTACQHLVPSVLRELKQSFPGYSITLVPGETPELVEALLEHRVDLALSLEVTSEPELKFHPLFTDELQFLAGPAHPWAKAGRVDRTQVGRQNYIIYSKRGATIRLIEDYFRREQMELGQIIEAGSVEATKELIKLGLGVGILAPWIAQKEIAEGTLVALPMGRRKLERQWGILHWQGKQLNLGEESFIGLCQTFCATLRTSGWLP